ncbi:hypothetical protein PC116_g2583 [Phytophthora cactorum]|nr:hypothetical protein PC114_g1223 [Phytophthora cactorum]KAG4063111.1 hypothetical protein PC123_g2054 [Phytophthora cactorum]KAG4249640.1 hypothetical protein PC116_g2583 [Phytophthora cactorum]
MRRTGMGLKAHKRCLRAAPSSMMESIWRGSSSSTGSSSRRLGPFLAGCSSIAKRRASSPR